MKMLEQLDLTPLYIMSQVLKLTTMCNTINGILYLVGYFVQSYFPYYSTHGILRPLNIFASANYLYSFVPLVTHFFVEGRTR